MTLNHLSQTLQQVTADLHQVNPWIGLMRFSLLGLIFLSLITLAWVTSVEVIAGTATVLAGLFYAFWLICTHDMVHQTLTGWRWFDPIVSRSIGWPMLWPYSTYSELHRLHHGWNGLDLRDPERVQWTQQEYQQVHSLVQWYVAHQWQIDIFLFGGIGLIIKTFVKGWQFRSFVPRMRRQLLLDIMGILVVQSTILAWVITHHQLLRYLLCWLVMERAIGLVIQARDHLEHYGLWGKVGNYQLTQLYTGRNLKTNALTGWLMGGLNYHAVHHAFPGIPFNQLPQAFERIQGVLQQHHLPLMILESGYLQSTWQLSRFPQLIDENEVSGVEIILSSNSQEIG